VRIASAPPRSVVCPDDEVSLPHVRQMPRVRKRPVEEITYRGHSASFVNVRMPFRISSYRRIASSSQRSAGKAVEGTPNYDATFRSKMTAESSTVASNFEPKERCFCFVLSYSNFNSTLRVGGV